MENGCSYSIFHFSFLMENENNGMYTDRICCFSVEFSSESNCIIALLTCDVWTLSAGVGRTFESVCLSVWLSVCSQRNSKTKDHKLFKLNW